MPVRLVLMGSLLLGLAAACGGGGSGVDGGTGGGGTGGGVIAGGGGGGGSGGGSGGDDGGVNASNLCSKYANALCSKQVQCGPMRAANLNDCFDDLYRSCELNEGAQLRAGAASLNGRLPQQCIAEISRSTCDLLPLTLDAYCNALVVPGAPVGGACTTGLCADSFCKVDGGRAGCGTCEAFLPLGAACTSTPQCDPDAGTCVISALTNSGTCTRYLEDGQACGNATRCRSKVCTSRPDGGSWCGPLNIGEPCSSATACGANAYCRGYGGASTQQSRCAARLPLGSTCVDERYDDGCQGGPEATCLDGICKVVAFATRTEGQSCDEANQCASDLYCLGIRNSISRAGTCTKKLGADAGCVVSAYPSECAFPLTCFQQTCQPLKSVGDSCSSTAQCGPYASCLTKTSTAPTCAAYVSVGDVCPAINMCLGGYCERLPDAGVGTCNQQKQLDATCTSSTECFSGRCYPASTGANTCAPGCF